MSHQEEVEKAKSIVHLMDTNSIEEVYNANQSEGMFYALTSGGYIRPEHFKNSPEFADQVREAIKTLEMLELIVEFGDQKLSGII